MAKRLKMEEILSPRKTRSGRLLGGATDGRRVEDPGNVGVEVPAVEEMMLDDDDAFGDLLGDATGTTNNEDNAEDRNIVDDDTQTDDTTEEASYEKVLPAELWVRVMEYVSHKEGRGTKDLCSVVLTSKYMNNLASSPALWTGTRLNKEKVIRDGLIPVFRINRFKKIKAIDLSDMGSWATPKRKQNVMKQLLETSLEEVNFSDNRMWRVSAEALAKGVAQLKAVNLSWTDLTTNQSIKLLEASISADTLEKVNLSYMDLSRVPASLLARAVCCLKAVNLTRTDLTTNQSSKLLEASISADTLEKVNLSYVNLSGVPASLLARAVSHLQTVKLRFTSLTEQQTTAMLEASLSSNSLVQVDLGGVDLSGVPGSLVARAVCRLQRAKLTDTDLTPEQSTEILDASHSSTSLVEVDLACVDLSDVPPQVLARAVGRLQSIDLNLTDLTGDQSIAVAQAVLSSTSLRYAHLDGEDESDFQKHLTPQLKNALESKDYVIM